MTPRRSPAPPSAPSSKPITPEDWFRARGWTPFKHQTEAWAAFRSGKEGLIHAPTGTGKTYAALFGPLAEEKQAPGLQVLWITPLRALANDLAFAIERPLSDLHTGWRVEVRTGDTPASKKLKQKANLPELLITTPESLALILTYEDVLPKLASLRAVVVDEWHELLSSKRGVLLELALARLRKLSPAARFWGVSATIGNLEQAAKVLTHTNDGGRDAVLVESDIEKESEIASIIPRDIERFPRSGHLGLTLLEEVLRAADQSRTTLLFTNVRSQAEAWYTAILEARPGYQAVLHHGSLDRKLREEAEAQVKSGRAKIAVATSSLDLGVDFPPVDLVIQVGSPKGIARLLQRLGRSGHVPGETSRMLCVPTNSFELFEYSAARRALSSRSVEARPPLLLSLDVLVQHIISSGLTGFSEEELLREVRSTHAFSALSETQWSWCLEFAAMGGKALRAYGQFQRLALTNGRYQVSSPQTAKLHRMSIGTIVSDTMVSVRFLRGKTLGNVEESFVARLKPGDTFSFAGRLLTLVQLRDMKAFVRKADKATSNVPRWLGGRLPLSTHLADAVRREITLEPDTPELRAAAPILELQRKWSMVPTERDLLVETVRMKSSFHLFLFPFAGFKVHEGLAAVVGHRITKLLPVSVTAIVNDYGLQLILSRPLEVSEQLLRTVLEPEGLLDDILASLNATELGRRQFREIARIAGLVFQGYPGASKTAKQLQISSGLLYDVFTKYDPENLLLEQSRREVLEEQLDFVRLKECLESIRVKVFQLRELTRLTPFSFPLWATFIRSQQSSEGWSDKIDRMIAELEEEVKNEKPQRRNRR